MWHYNNKLFENTPEEYQGFVYEITELDTGKKYIGKKNFWKPKTLPITKTRKRRVRTRTESDWKTYYGSSKELNGDRKRLGSDSFTREILSTHATAGRVNYEETKQLFLNNVLQETLDDGTPKYYNSNILGRYYKKDYFTEQ